MDVTAPVLPPPPWVEHVTTALGVLYVLLAIALVGCILVGVYWFAAARDDARRERRRGRLLARAQQWETRAGEAERAVGEHRELGLTESAASQAEVAALYRSWAADLRQSLTPTHPDTPSRTPHPPSTRGIRRPDRPER